MIGTREAIMASLFELLSTTPGFASYWRKFPVLEQLTPAQKPALAMRVKNEDVSAYFGTPAKYQILIEVCLIIDTPSSPGDEVPYQSIGGLLDAVETTLRPDITGLLRLSNPNISRVWIEGQIEIWEAIQSDLSLAYVPINVIAV